MSKEKKIRLKEMSHKKLRKLCKRLGKECAEYSKQVGLYKSVEIRNAETIGELKSYVRSLEKTLASEARRVKEKNEKLEEKNKRIEELEKQLEAFGNSRVPTPYIGELPEDVGMGIDGQLRPYREMSDTEHQAWVAREVARAMQECATDEQRELVENYDNVHEEQIEGNCIGHTPAKPIGVSKSDSQRVDMVGALFGVPQADGYIPKTEQIVTPVSQEQINKKMDEAIEWAKRNGHHQPEGNPEPNKMDAVRFKSADEISQENVEKHTEMVCNDIIKDESRFL